MERPYRTEEAARVGTDRPGTPRVGTPGLPLPAPEMVVMAPPPRAAPNEVNEGLLQEVLHQMTEMHRANTEFVRREKAQCTVTQMREEVQRQLEYSRGDVTLLDGLAGPVVTPI